jgi:hypothetical protein
MYEMRIEHQPGKQHMQMHLVESRVSSVVLTVTRRKSFCSLFQRSKHRIWKNVFEESSKKYRTLQIVKTSVTEGKKILVIQHSSVKNEFSNPYDPSLHN